MTIYSRIVNQIRDFQC